MPLIYDNMISIHAPARGATEKMVMRFILSKISIHAPARGATGLDSLNLKGPYISIHAPARGATVQFVIQYPDVMISIHAPARGATCFLAIVDVTSLFQSTLPRGERRSRVTLDKLHLDFNPRSREGSDPYHFPQSVTDTISIHAPARGATQQSRQKSQQ